MIVSIALRECYNNLVSARFIIGFVLCLLLIPFSIVVGIQEYQSRVAVYEVEQAQARESTQVHVWSEYRPVVVKPLEPLSILSKGISGTVGNQVTTRLGEVPMLAAGQTSVRQNPFLNSIFTLDFVTVLAILMSLLALVFSYDVCTGEKEAGTLKLLLTNPVSRSVVLAGKGLGILLTLLPIIAFCYLLSALIIVLYADASLAVADWARMLFLAVISIVYFSTFVALGMFVSSRSRSSVTSMVICLFVWVVFMFIIPNGAVYAARSFVTVRSMENLQSSLDEIDIECRNRMNQEVSVLSRDGIWFMHFRMDGGDDGYMRLWGAEKRVYEYYRQQFAIQEPIRIDYADRKWSVQQVYLDELHRQANTAHALGMISPVQLFRQAADALCRTDMEAHDSFMTATRRYREEVLDYFNAKNAYGSYLWFTSIDPETFLSADKLIESVTAGRFTTLAEYDAWAATSDNPFSAFVYNDPVWFDDSIPAIEVSDAPVFSWRPDSVAVSMKKSLAGLGGMALAVLLLFFLSFVSFSRFDVR